MTLTTVFYLSCALISGHLSMMLLDFFFQAEDGIRDLTVTGVQTCALPIWLRAPAGQRGHCPSRPPARRRRSSRGAPAAGAPRARPRVPRRAGVPRLAGSAGREPKSVVEGKSVDLGGRRII